MKGPNVFFLWLFFLAFASKVYTQGHLVIAGGGLKADNAAVFREFIRLAGGAKARIGIIPSASGTPMAAYQGFKEILVKHGMSESIIFLIPLATEDDPETPENESLWRSNAFNPRVDSLIRTCTGIWFSGGDQMRTTSVLLTKDGKPTPALEAVRFVMANGGVVGGTSAGAAIQSQFMIGGGTSLGALTYGITHEMTDEVDEKGLLLLARGLGFFPFGIIDQHFDRKARLGRLCMALMHQPVEQRVGFGIDENTAMIVDLKKRHFFVKGAAGVTIVDANAASYNKAMGLWHIKGIVISYISADDTVSFDSWTLNPAKGKKPTRHLEFYNEPVPASMGILAGYGNSFKDMITYNLIDNKAVERLSALTVNRENGTGFQVDFYKLPESEGFFMDLPDDEIYTVWKIGMDITPFSFAIHLHDQ